MKKIILEGPDLAGKTTLINELLKIKKFNNSLVIKNNFIPKNYEEHTKLMDKYFELLVFSNKLFSYNYIFFDRLFLSEIVYGKLLRNYNCSNEEKLLNLIKSNIYEKIILLLPPLETLENRWNIRGDSRINKSQLKEIYNLYEELKISIPKEKLILLEDTNEYLIRALGNDL